MTKGEIFVGYLNAKEHASPGQHPECFEGMLCVPVDSRLRGNDKPARECHVIPQHVYK
ncbi:MAG: hypothetical protein JXB07_12920 [Anaerolineae bacterium]|nr:hypothetical protein [Anaerolineae bacterium]